MRAPSKRSSPVAEACRPSLSSSRPTREARACRPGTMNALISASPSSRVPVRAVTMYVPGLAGVGDEPLAAVDDPRAAVGAVLVAGRRPRPARVAAGARLGQAVGADDLAAAPSGRGTAPSARRCRRGGAARSRGSCARRRSARASPRPGRSPRPRSRRRACRGRRRPRPRGSGCRASRARRCAGRSRSGSGARARARSMTGATSVSMKSRIVSRSSACSGERSRSIAGERSTGRRRRAPSAGASLPAMPEPDRVGARRAGAPMPSAAPGARRRRPVRACDATSCCASASTARARPTSSPTGSARQPDRRPPAAPRARGRRTSSSRQTVRHGVGRPRHLYDVTPRRPGPLPVELRRPRRRPARGDRGGRRRRPARARSSRRAAASSATGSATSWPSASPADAPLADRVRELAVIQDEQGYLAEAVVGADGVDPPARAQLRDLPRRAGHAGRLPGRARAVPRGPRRRRRPRDAHRVGRPLLLLPDRGRRRRTLDPRLRPLRAPRRRAARGSQDAAPARRRRSARTRPRARSPRPAPGPPTDRIPSRPELAPARRGCRS